MTEEPDAPTAGPPTDADRAPASLVRRPAAEPTEALAERHAYIDAAAGVSGPMLLGALVGAGADLGGVEAVTDALLPAAVRLTSHSVHRSGQQTTLVALECAGAEAAPRTWSEARSVLADAQHRAAAPARTLELALEAVSLLADAEDPAEHQAEVLEELASVIGACEAWRRLGIGEATVSEIAVGPERLLARSEDGTTDGPVHTHAYQDPYGVRHLQHVVAGDGVGHSHSLQEAVASGRPDPRTEAREQLSARTGIALVRTLARTSGPLPPITLAAVGVGAGLQDTPERANVVRVLLGTYPAGPPDDGPGAARGHRALPSTD
ncbi:hypothetical protein DEO23_09160 [Brachybacterium endophyticum]|uniref:Uncharacterized protein n=1 Tax=Brachybacterium endophyticum TaxID=2182385 RepID=A0A2U2RJD0_9MICO|nr:nickel insertion protein [Brachybacterium endophyticum]PWH05982.1 hypothetical protein DEO23_09160 [Brachybacterium endophyticum]